MEIEIYLQILKCEIYKCTKMFSPELFPHSKILFLTPSCSFKSVYCYDAVYSWFMKGDSISKQAASKQLLCRETTCLCEKTCFTFFLFYNVCRNIDCLYQVLWEIIFCFLTINFPKRLEPDVIYNRFVLINLQCNTFSLIRLYVEKKQNTKKSWMEI